MIVSPTSETPLTPDTLIDPRIMQRLERLDFRSTKLFPGKMQGERRSKRRGQSVEFDDFRRYTPGDDPRFIDWNAYARFGKLFLKLFLEEEDLAVHLLIDASASMDAGRPSKLRFAASAAAALGYIGLARQNRLTVTVFGAPGMPRPARFPESRGRHRYPALADFIVENALPKRERGSRAASLGGRPQPQAAFERALRDAAIARATAGVFVLFSDFLLDEGYETGLRTLATAGRTHDIFCLQILAPDEIEPDKAFTQDGGLAGDLRLTDIETGNATEITVSAELIKAYKRRLDDYRETLASYCAARGMRYLLARSDDRMQQLLMHTLRRAGAIG